MADEQDELRTLETAVVLDEDEALDEAAQGHDLNSDTAPDADEVGAMGRAAGLPPLADAPFSGVDAVDRRDRHRWELDPRSAETADPDRGA